MTTTQLTLTPSEASALAALGRSQGKTQEEVLHEAVEQYLPSHIPLQCDNANRLSALRQGRGIWRERNDLPDFAKLRNELNRF